MKRLWPVAALDLVFLVLGYVLLLADGFERGIDHVRLRFARAASADGRIVRDTRSFTVALDGASLCVAGEPIEPSALLECAKEAFEQGASEAVVAVAADVDVAALVPVLSTLRNAGFETVLIPYFTENPTKESAR